MQDKSITEIEKKLNDRYEKYFMPLIKKYNITEIKKTVYGNHAFIDAKSKNITIRLVNDRGLVDFKIGHSDKKDIFLEVELITGLFNKKMERSQGGAIRLSLEEQSEIIDNNWDQLQTLFRKYNSENIFTRSPRSSLCK